jgi:drug/metabolite transporter (DMT)-like permease
VTGERAGVAFALLAALGFSLKAVFVKLAYAAAPVEPITLLTLRMMLSLPIVLVAGRAAIRDGASMPRRDWLLVVALGVVGYYLSSWLDFLGLQFISVGLERLILFTYPTLTILIGTIVFGRAFDRRLIPAIVLSYAGVAFAFAHDLNVAGEWNRVLTGSLLVLGSAVAYALYSSGTEVAVARVGTARLSTLALLVSTAAVTGHFVATQQVSSLAQPWRVYAWAGAMALFSTVFPVFWQTAAIRRIGAARAVVVGTLGPVLTIAFGWWLLGEPISGAQLAGAALVIGGVMIVARPTWSPPVQTGGRSD